MQTRLSLLYLRQFNMNLFFFSFLINVMQCHKYYSPVGVVVGDKQKEAVLCNVSFFKEVCQR